MKLKVNSDGSIVEFQNEFNRLFPYLRVDFFSNGHSERGTSVLYGPPLNKGTFGQFTTIQNPHTVEIDQDLSVAELKRIFKVEFGLNVRIYRKSDNFWLETNLTEKLTLAQQNQHGKDLS